MFECWRVIYYKTYSSGNHPRMRDFAYKVGDMQQTMMMASARVYALTSWVYKEEIR